MVVSKTFPELGLFLDAEPLGIIQKNQDRPQPMCLHHPPPDILLQVQVAVIEPHLRQRYSLQLTPDSGAFPVWPLLRHSLLCAIQWLAIARTAPWW